MRKNKKYNLMMIIKIKIKFLRKNKKSKNQFIKMKMKTYMNKTNFNKKLIKVRL